MCARVRVCFYKPKSLHVHINFVTLSLDFCVFLCMHAHVCVRENESINGDTGEELPLWLYPEAMSWATVVCSEPLTTISLKTNSATCYLCLCNSSSREMEIDCKIVNIAGVVQEKKKNSPGGCHDWLHQCHYSKSQITSINWCLGAAWKISVPA